MENFPNPEELKKYQSIDSSLINYFKEINKTFIENSKELEAQELKNKRKGIFNERLKIIFAFLSSSFLIVLSLYALYLSYSWAASVIAVSGVGGAIMAFVGKIITFRKK